MKLTTKQLEYLVARYWLHYYPELVARRWTSVQVKSVAAIETELQRFEYELYEGGLLSLPRYYIMDRSTNQPRFKHFEWRLEVSGYGASVVESRCAMDLMLKLGEILQLTEGSPLSAWQRIAIRCRPRDFVIARVMRQISKANLPELLAHGHEFIRGAAAQRLVDTFNEGTRVYQYRYDGGGTGSFRGSVLSL